MSDIFVSECMEWDNNLRKGSKGNQRWMDRRGEHRCITRKYNYGDINKGFGSQQKQKHLCYLSRRQSDSSDDDDDDDVSFTSYEDGESSAEMDDSDADDDDESVQEERKVKPRTGSRKEDKMRRERKRSRTERRNKKTAKCEHDSLEEEMRDGRYHLGRSHLYGRCLTKEKLPGTMTADVKRKERKVTMKRKIRKTKERSRPAKRRKEDPEVYSGDECCGYCHARKGPKNEPEGKSQVQGSKNNHRQETKNNDAGGDAAGGGNDGEVPKRSAGVTEKKQTDSKEVTIVLPKRSDRDAKRSSGSDVAVPKKEEPDRESQKEKPIDHSGSGGKPEDEKLEKSVKVLGTGFLRVPNWGALTFTRLATRKKGKKKGKRNIAPFIKFYMTVYKELCNICSNTSIAIEAGKRWRCMSAKEKAKYYSKKKKK